MNQRPEPSEFLSDEDYAEAVASMLSPSDELEIITGGHHDIIEKRTQRIADRQKLSKDRVALRSAQIAALRDAIADEKAQAAHEIEIDRRIIAMSRAALSVQPKRKARA